MCSQCEAKDEHEPSAWFNHVWFLWRLQRGGYPFKQEDLSLDEWHALGELDDAIKSYRGK